MNARSTALVAALPVLLAFAGARPASAADAYTVDASHSAAIFRVQHANAGYQYGRFNDVAGEFLVDEADASKSSVRIEVKAASVDTFNAKRDDHLRSPDFLNVAQFPTIAFASTAVKAVEGGYEVTGKFTLHGVTKDVTVRMAKTGQAKDPWGNNRIGFEGTLTIKRSDYGMNQMLEVVGDEVRLTLAIEGIKK
jgi:polyisoprenoid-binding protein YceI